jgi:hypothetical protein
MKTEVYSWRVSSGLKTALEREARRRKTSVAATLDLAVREWLNKASAGNDGEEEQIRLRKAASKWLGSLAGADAEQSENASRTVRQRLRIAIQSRERLSPQPPPRFGF